MIANLGSSILSVPSWVIPGTYAENLRFLENQKEVQGVELLFFIYNDEVKAQLDSEWEEICQYNKRFVFTAHLPEPLLPAHEELIARLASMVRHFIVHPAKENPVTQALFLEELAKKYESIFLVENTKPSLLDSLLPHIKPDAGLCMDTGHLILEGKNPADFFTRYKQRIGEIHLHSVDKEKAVIDKRLPDHRQLREESWLLELLPLLKNYQGVINLEVFSWEEANASIETLKKLQALT